MHTILQYMSLPLEFSLILLIFTLGGYGLDSYWGTSPIFVIIGVLVGMAGGFYHLIKTTSTFSKKK